MGLHGICSLPNIMATTLVDSVIHWRKKLDKNTDEDVILNVIHKLSKIPITLEILEVTHIGKCIRKLSKRDDIVGEKAKAVLRKWRNTFANPESDKNSKLSGTSKKENVHKESKSSHKKEEKTVHYQKKVSHKYEQSNSLSHNLSQLSKKYINGHSVNLGDSSPLSHNFDGNETHLNYLGYDPHAEVSEGYNPECPELFPADAKSERTKIISDDAYKPSSLKRKFISEDNAEPVNNSLSKQLKNNTISDSNCTSKQSFKEREKLSYGKDNSKGHLSLPLKKESEKNNSIKHSSNVKAKNKQSSDSKGKEHKKSKLKIHSSEEFTSSHVSFEDCLGFNDVVSVKKKKSSKSQPSTKSATSPVSDKNKSTGKKSLSKGSLHANKEKVPVKIPKPSKKKLDVADITSTLPEIQPNYKPLPRTSDFYSPKKKEVLTNEEAIKFTSSRREKTAVYSGRKSYFTEVPSLAEFCTRILIENIDAIEEMGGMPYFLLKSVLERCTPSQLFNIEGYNPYLLESTNELWKIHCRRDYRLLTPLEHETWRDLYLRAHDEREQKLKNVTANISASMLKSNPVRQVKLAYVDSFAKPPRDVARRQAKNGTAVPVSHPVKTGPPSKASPRPTAPAINSSNIINGHTATTTSSSGFNSSSNATSAIFIPKKPKIAPLMAKTLKSMKQCFRR